MGSILKEVLLLFVPGGAGVLFYRVLEKKKWSAWTYIENYAVFTFMAYFLTRNAFYLSGLQEFSITEIDLAVQIKFGILSIILVVAAALAIHYGKAVWKIGRQP